MEMTSNTAILSSTPASTASTLSSIGLGAPIRKTLGAFPEELPQEAPIADINARKREIQAYLRTERHLYSLRSAIFSSIDIILELFIMDLTNPARVLSRFHEMCKGGSCHTSVVL